MFDVSQPGTSLEVALFFAAALVIVAVLVSKASARVGVPAFLLFIGVGMLAGSDGPGGIHFADVSLAQGLGVVALGYILFSGGLDTHWSEVRSSLRNATLLATAGVGITAVAVALFARYFLGFSLAEGFLLGAVISSTDAAAVFAVLRTAAVPVSSRLRALLELESGCNDPMAVFLTTAAIALLAGQHFSAAGVAGKFVLEMGIGAVAGVIFARLIAAVMNRIHLEASGLYPVLTTAFVIATYSATSLVHGNGFLAVYVAGVALGRQRFVQKRTLTRYHDGVAWLMQVTMFLVLGLLVFPSQLKSVAGAGFAVALFLILIARPAAVFATLAFSGLSVRDKAFVAWAGLRGAVPIILATFPLLARVPRAEAIFNIVFFVVITSVLIQGPTLGFAARLLRSSGAREVEDERRRAQRDSDLVTLVPSAASHVVGSTVVALDLPEDALILALYRNGAFFVPSGSTEIQAGDRLMMLVNKRSVDRVRQLIEQERSPG